MRIISVYCVLQLCDFQAHLHHHSLDTLNALEKLINQNFPKKVLCVLKTSLIQIFAQIDCNPQRHVE